MPMDYKRVLREREERQRVDAGEPAVVAERGDGDGNGPVRVGQGAPYPVADGDQETTETGEAGQTEDAATAAQRAERRAEDAGADEAAADQAASAAEEEVLPHGG
jgi:hypothetical protein